MEPDTLSRTMTKTLAKIGVFLLVAPITPCILAITAAIKYFQ
jgi:hypothetical protein